MSRILTIEPEAEAEIAEAARWYGERSDFLRIKFLNSVDEALEIIQRHPEQHQRVP